MESIVINPLYSLLLFIPSPPRRPPQGSPKAAGQRQQLQICLPSGNMLAASALAHLYAILAQFCNSQQDFSPEIFVTTPLTSGVRVNATLCPQHWVWFSMETRTLANYTRLEQQGVNWVHRPVSETINNAVTVAVDAAYDYQRWRFTTLSVLLVNGTPPVD